MTWRRNITHRGYATVSGASGAVSQDVKTCGVAVRAGMEHVRLKTKTLHETESWLVATNLSSAFNTKNMTAVFTEMANRVPAITPCCDQMLVAQYQWT